MIYEVEAGFAHNIFIEPGSWQPNGVAQWVGGLVGGLPDLPSIHTGIWGGPVTLDAEARSHEPRDVTTDDWEDGAEVSIKATDTPLRIEGFAWTASSRAPELSRAPGWHRVLVMARGRDSLVDQVSTEPLEAYLIRVWKAPYASPRLLKAESQVARGFPRA